MGLLESLFNLSAYFDVKQAPDAIPRGLRGWGSKNDNMEITWEVRHVQGKTLHLVNTIH